MAKWLAAFAKGLSYAAGPFKPVVDSVLRLYDGELAERADAKLQKMIVEGQDLTREVLYELKEIRQSTGVTSEQFANGATAVISVIREKGLKIASPEELQAAIAADFVDSNADAFWRNGFVAIATIEKECIKCFGSPAMFEQFLMLLRRGGFDISGLSHNSPRNATIAECIRQTFSPVYTIKTQAAIINELASAARGSEILQMAYRLLLP